MTSDIFDVDPDKRPRVTNVKITYIDIFFLTLGEDTGGGDDSRSHNLNCAKLCC